MLFDYNQIIDDRLWVGALIRPEDVRQLRRMGITTILSLQTPKDLKKHGIAPKKLDKALKEAALDYIQIPITEFDSPELERHLPEAVAALERALTPAWAKVYLHCSAGVIPSATVAAAYLGKTKGLSAEEAAALLKSRRECEPDAEVLVKFGQARDRETTGC